MTLPSDPKKRKSIPLCRGVLDYFPAALAEIAKLSAAGNDKHNPGEDLHHARGKSTDHADCILRHLMERGTIDAEDGLLHEVKLAWRALALLQESLERLGAPLARGARAPAPPAPSVQAAPSYETEQAAWLAGSSECDAVGSWSAEDGDTLEFEIRTSGGAVELAFVGPIDEDDADEARRMIAEAALATKVWE